MDVVILLAALGGLAHLWRHTMTRPAVPVLPAVLAPADGDLLDWAAAHPDRAHAPADLSELDRR